VINWALLTISVQWKLPQEDQKKGRWKECILWLLDFRHAFPCWAKNELKCPTDTMRENRSFLKEIPPLKIEIW
jgi:hypothetical protein